VERNEVADRQLDALLQRLDRLCDEVHDLNRRLDSAEGLARIAKELSTLNESLQALAYAALGAQAPTVRRRRA
jgi:chromosome segregation ATPase